MSVIQRGTVLEASSLVELLRLRGSRQADTLAYTYLSDGDAPGSELTLGELDLRARSIAAHLQSLDLSGERVLLLYPAGLDYVAAFFGCLYAGAVAVPAYPPHPKRPMGRIESIIASCTPRAALSTASLVQSLRQRFGDVPALGRLHWLTTDDLPNDAAQRWTDPGANSETLAFLQYTSGSTGEPKGVMITHGNLLHNLQVIHEAFRPRSDGVGVTWLPIYHDMGLIGGILEPLYAGGPAILLSPTAFLQRPACWLEAISRYRGTINGGPNFAYELCIQRVTPEQRAKLDLSCWDLAFSGAEPVRRQTLERFAEVFAPCGFRKDVFFPCYGLAEATLMASGASGPGRVRSLAVDKQALDRHEVQLAAADDPGAKDVVSCGKSVAAQTLVIVDPQTAVRCPEGRVGEIWIAGPSVAEGYWNRPDLTAQVFHASLGDSGEGPFLRTGDLGFLRDGELYVTGRVKDLIIVRGRNHYPHDIELTVERAHPTLRAGGGAAFAVEREQGERVVVVQEVAREALRGLASDDVLRAIVEAVSTQHELSPEAVLLLQPGSMPRTSSGKTQRYACREGYLDGTLNVIARWPANPTPPEPDSRNEGESPVDASPVPHPKPAWDGQPAASAGEIQAWIVAWLARKLQMPAASIRPDRSIASLGLDSLAAMELIRDAEDRLQCRIEAAMLWNFPTLESLSNHLAERWGAEDTPTTRDEAGPRMVAGEAAASCTLAAGSTGRSQATTQFSLFYFSCDADQVQGDKYRLLLDGARFADRHDFTAVWIPERHFHSFGGVYPSPSVLGAALSQVTQRVRLRAGSVVLPLHDPIRVAEEWSIVDNLSHGRVDLAFAAGWNPNDFVLAPDRYAQRTESMYEAIDVVRRLWRGEPIDRRNGAGNDVPTSIHPRPLQADVAVWITCSGGKERFAEAGARGANVLTALLFQNVEELAEKIAIYRQARAEHGHDPAAGHVTLMLHTFLGTDEDEVRARVRQPFLNYLQTSTDLWRHALKDPRELAEQDHQRLLEFAFERYYRTSALFGTPESCAAMVERLAAAGVDEVACLIDFGIEVEAVMHSLESLDELRRRFSGTKPTADASARGTGTTGAARHGAPRAAPGLASEPAVSRPEPAAFVPLVTRPKRKWYEWWPLPRRDGFVLTGESATRLIQPYVMPRRSDSLAYYETTFDLSRTLPWLEAYNRAQPRQAMTLFDLLLWAIAYTSHRRPGMNRFVSGGRIYQRERVTISFAAKKSFELAAPLTTIKVELPADDSLAAAAARIAAAIDEGRKGPPRQVDREIDLLMRLPRWMVALALGAYRRLDRWNLIPGAMLESDPMYSSVFVANLGSIGLDCAFHHLYEFGTTSVFAALGVVKKTVFADPDGTLAVRDAVQVKWTIDTRVVDGFYNAWCLQLIQAIVEDVERFASSPTDAARDAGRGGNP